MCATLAHRHTVRNAFEMLRPQRKRPRWMWESSK